MKDLHMKTKTLNKECEDVTRWNNSQACGLAEYREKLYY